jgi:hypothetical protein
MPAEPPLTDPERTVLDVLMAPGRRVANCTTEAIGERSELGAQEAGRALRSLEERDPALVRQDVDEGLGVRLWMSTHGRLSRWRTGAGASTRSR